MNVVVGKADVGRETPLFERNMSYIIFRPYWVITPSIIRSGLATWILRDPRTWSRRQIEQVMNGANSRRVNLTRQIPVVIYYTTAVVWPDGKVGFFDDVYKHDARLESVLAKGYPFAP